MQQFAIPADEAEIDSPGIDGYPVDLVNRFRPTTDALTDVVEEPEGIPVKACRKLNGDIRKAMELLQFDPSLGDLSQYGAPALCA
jgi:hypothetical protein